METRANLVSVGLFVLAVIAIAFFSAYWLLRGSDAGHRTQLTVVFPGSVSGLVTGASVSFNGIKVGEVKRLSFAPDDPARVIANLDVDGATPIKTDSHVSLGYQGLTGVSFVQIWGGSAAAKSLFDLEERDRVMLAERSSVQDIMEGAQRVLARVDSAVASVEETIRDNKDAVNQTVHNAQVFSDALAKNSDGVAAFMKSVSDAGAVLAKVSEKADRLVENVDGLVQSVDRDKVASIVDHVEQLSSRLDEASKRVDGILAKVDGLAGSEEGKGLAVQASGFLAEATDAARALKETARTFQARADDIAGGVDRLTDGGLRELKGFIADGRRTLGTIDRAVGNIDRDPKRLIFGGPGGNVPEYTGNRR